MYHIIGYQTNPITGETLFNILCDTVADLPSSPVSDNGYGGEIGQGSKAVIIADGSTYLADSNSNWIYQPNPNAWVNVYTKTEIDSMLQDKQNVLTFDALSARDSTNALTSGGVWDSVWSQVLGVNTTKNLAQDIPAGGYDLNTITETGIYRIPSAAVARQIAHVPQQAAARLIVSNIALDNRYFQIWISAGARVFIRSYISTGWQHWFEYVGNDTGV